MAIFNRQIQANGMRFRVACHEQKVAAKASKTNSSSTSILFLHGYPEGSISWHPVMALLPNVCSYAPDLRGYPGSEYTHKGYDVFTLLEDIKTIIERLGLKKPMLVTHDWGGALGWMFAHLYPELISHLMVVNCPHPKTLVRAVFQFEDFQTLRIPWVPYFQIPFFPEWSLTTPLGRKFLRLTFTLREGRPNTMNTRLVQDLVARFQSAIDMRGPVEFYREIVKTILLPNRRLRLEKLYARPIEVPCTLVWGDQDEALSIQVAKKSHCAAQRYVEWRPLPGVGHFVMLEAPELLADEILRVY